MTTRPSRALRKALKLADAPVRSQAEEWVAERRLRAERRDEREPVADSPEQQRSQDAKLARGNQRVQGARGEGAASATGPAGTQPVVRPHWPAPWIEVPPGRPRRQRSKRDRAS
jgi:hypothetical protein